MFSSLSHMQNILQAYFQKPSTRPELYLTFHTPWEEEKSLSQQSLHNVNRDMWSAATTASVQASQALTAV